jgi:hypothetical protein
MRYLAVAHLYPKHITITFLHMFIKHMHKDSIIIYKRCTIYVLVHYSEMKHIP